MSFIVLAIGAAHALPPILGATIGKSKGGVIAGAMIGGVIAIAMGRSAYVVIDMVGVALGAWLGFSIVKDKAPS